MGKVIKWTQEEDEFLIKNSSKYTKKELSEIIEGRTLSSITSRVQKLGLKTKRIAGWTDEENNFLIKNAHAMSCLELSNYLECRSKDAVYVQIKKLGLNGVSGRISDEKKKKVIELYETETLSNISKILKISELSVYKIALSEGKHKTTRWTEEEDDIMLREYAHMSNNELVSILPNRSVRAISTRASKLGLKKEKIKRWSKDEDSLILDLCENNTYQDIAKTLGDVTVEQVITRAYKLGVRAVTRNTGWSCSKWIECANSSSGFDGFKLYKIKCWSDDEEFYKIGITSMKIKTRFTSRFMPYNYKVIEVVESEDGKYIWDLEKELHKKHKEFKYKPNIKFGGWTECFSELIE